MPLWKDELKKEISAQNETINDVLKQNASLNDEIKVKAEIIKMLQEKEDKQDEDETTSNVFSKERNGTHKCKECDYTTNVAKYLKSHMLAHTGQYQCQRGCKEWFQTQKTLDNHHMLKQQKLRW